MSGIIPRHMRTYAVEESEQTLLTADGQVNEPLTQGFYYPQTTPPSLAENQHNVSRYNL